MKIAILGYSGSGKSTLARQLVEALELPCLHLDQVQFLSGWKERPQGEKLSMVQAFLDQNSSWIIDGNYSSLCYARRLEEADHILLLEFSRLRCLWQAQKRWRAYRGTTRPDMAAGCPEKIDSEFIWWILRDGRTPKKRALLADVGRNYPDKTWRMTSPAAVRRCREALTAGNETLQSEPETMCRKV